MDISNNNNNAETTIDALASLSLSVPESALSSTVDEDGKVGSADNVAQQAVQIDAIAAAIPSTTHNTTTALSTANQLSDIDVDVEGLLDDVDAVITHQELSCMKLGELKELCKKKGLSTKGNMTTLIDRYLLAQKNGFPTKKKQPVPPAKRMAKSRANRSDEKKKEDNKKM